MRNILAGIFFSALISFLLSGCLTVEKKEYTFELTGKNAGKLTIRYINIMSVMDDDQDVSEADYAELISDYVEGTKIEDEYPTATLVSKRLYKENDLLCGEVIFEFTDLAAAKLYQYDKNSPLMYAICDGLYSETYQTCNGTHGGDFMPVVMWPGNSKLLTFTTTSTEPSESTISLIDYFEE